MRDVQVFEDQILVIFPSIVVFTHRCILLLLQNSSSAGYTYKIVAKKKKVEVTDLLRCNLLYFDIRNIVLQ